MVGSEREGDLDESIDSLCVPGFQFNRKERVNGVSDTAINIILREVKWQAGRQRQ
jgi:hypothetical protein